MKLSGSCALVPVKSNVAERDALVDADLHRHTRAIVHLIVERAIVEPVEQSPHRLLGIGEDVPHVGGDDFGAVVASGRGEHLRAAHAGGELGLQVGDVAVDVPRRPSARSEQRADLAFEEAALIDEQRIVDQHAFLVDRAAVGRHRSGRDPADVGMVPARRDEGGRLGVFVAVEDRHDHRDVGQVRSAAIGIVEHIGVAAPDAAPVAPLRRAFR